MISNPRAKGDTRSLSFAKWNYWNVNLVKIHLAKQTLTLVKHYMALVNDTKMLAISVVQLLH